MSMDRKFMAPGEQLMMDVDLHRTNVRTSAAKGRGIGQVFGYLQPLE
jgi:hypothetical protein